MVLHEKSLVLFASSQQPLTAMVCVLLPKYGTLASLKSDNGVEKTNLETTNTVGRSVNLNLDQIPLCHGKQKLSHLKPRYLAWLAPGRGEKSVVIKLIQRGGFASI